ncbi:MAG: hypothetical protein RIA69_05675 [Cyclobacteriaceae bacterium]
MKKIFSLVAMVFLLMPMACNNDEEEIPNPEVSSDDITFGANAASIQSATFLELGNYDVINADYAQGEETDFQSATHYGTVFRLSDGTYDSTTFSFNDAEILIRTELFSSGGSSFRRGTFEFIEETELNGQPSFGVGKNFFSDLVVEYQGETSSATAGTIAIAGTSPDWIISFDVTVGVSTRLRGAYDGGMVKLD